MPGILMGLGASIAFGLYTALSKRCVGRLGGMTVNSLSFLTGAIMELIVLLAMGQPVIAGITTQTLPVLIYVSFVVTGFGYFCFMRAIERTGASTASYAFFIKPLIAIGLAALILSGAITWNIIVGSLIILGGCIFNAYKPKAVSAS